jgi:hypothetical protein
VGLGAGEALGAVGEAIGAAGEAIGAAGEALGAVVAAAGLALEAGAAVAAAGDTRGAGVDGGASVGWPAGYVSGTSRTYPTETVPSLGIVVSAVVVE